MSRGAFMRECSADGRWYPWSYHSTDLIGRIMAYGLKRGRHYLIQERPGGPCVEYRAPELTRDTSDVGSPKIRDLIEQINEAAAEGKK